VYALTAVHNFINMNNPDDPGYFPEVQDEVVDEEDARLTEAESDVAINQRRDEIAELIWQSYCEVIGRPID
jgi:hypothetical protein